jgi:hypothetical protein
MAVLGKHYQWATGILIGGLTAAGAWAQEAVSPAAVVPATSYILPQGTGVPPSAAETLPAPNAVPRAAATVAGASCDTTGGSAAPAPSVWQRFKEKMRSCIWGYPDQFESPPLGYMVSLQGRTQVANAEIARMTLYRYDFEEHGTRLTARGKYQLQKIVGLLPLNFAPLVIEETPGDGALDLARRTAVLNELGSQPFPIPPERVVVARPIAVGLPGEQALAVYGNLIRDVRNQGIPSGAGGGRPGGNINVGTFGGAGAQTGATGP